jgi:hypothetical protein
MRHVPLARRLGVWGTISWAMENPIPGGNGGCVKSKKLQTKTPNGKPENAGKFIVADEKLLPIFRNTKVTSISFQ